MDTQRRYCEVNDQAARRVDGGEDVETVAAWESEMFREIATGVHWLRDTW
jgi:hypothetical protein